jgi:hypothetical protein
MGGRRKSVPMETQPVHRSADTAKPMAHASAKRGQAPEASTSALPRGQSERARKRALEKQRGMLKK